MSILMTCVSDGSTEMLGHDGADRVALAVIGLLAEQDEVRALALERLGQRVAGRGDVGAGQRRRR